MAENDINILADKKKKNIIIFLLVVSCITCVFLLSYLPSTQSRHLKDIAQTDTLISRELSDFNIKPAQIHVHTLKVNNTFHRKIYDISLPPGFSKTYLHADLTRKLDPYDVKTPARLHLTDNDMDIELYYDGTVIRTLKLKTDTTFNMHRSPGSILVYFNHKPTSRLIHKFKTLGESVSFVFRVKTATQGRDWLDALHLKNLSVIYWIQKDFEYHNTHNRSDWYLNNQLKILKKLVSRPAILIAPTIDEQTRDMIQKDGELLGLSIVRTDYILYNGQQLTQPEFNNELQKFSKLAYNGRRPVLLIKASGDSYDWLVNQLPDLKKGGLVLVPPIIDHY
jgi:hypothetical protein